MKSIASGVIGGEGRSVRGRVSSFIRPAGACKIIRRRPWTRSAARMTSSIVKVSGPPTSRVALFAAGVTSASATSAPMSSTNTGARSWRPLPICGTNGSHRDIPRNLLREWSPGP